MHTLARPPVRETPLKSQARLRAFTLIELLTVIAIIAILAAITFGVIKGVNERAAFNQARAELAAIAQSLEAYKQQYGDYPRITLGSAANPAVSGTIATTNTQALLFNALVGKLGPKLSNTAEINASAINQKSFIELSRFSLETTNMPATNNSTAVANSFLDPWGRRYMYYYNSVASGWRHPGYVLYSVGPDGAHTAPNATVLNDTATNNSDNVYAGK